MSLNRRDFLRTCAITIGTLSVPLLSRDGKADDPPKTVDVPIAWVATGSCSGCSVSLLNVDAPTIQEALLGEVLPGKHLSLRFHSTVMAAQGDLAVGALLKLQEEEKGKYVLAVEGATATKEGGKYCNVGEKDGKVFYGDKTVQDLARDALAVLAIGTCASYGGIPAAAPNPTGCLGTGELLKRAGIKTPIVNIPGCAPHPDWIVGTIAQILVAGLGGLKVDKDGRPAPFYSSLIHDNCPFRGHFDRSHFAEHFGEHGCLVKLGCKGPRTHADCPERRWNNKTSWCIEAGHPCIGCVEPDFPFEGSLFRIVQPAELAPPDTVPAATAAPVAKPFDLDSTLAIGAVGGGALVGTGVLATKLAQRQKPARPSSESPAPAAKEQRDSEPD